MSVFVVCVLLFVYASKSSLGGSFLSTGSLKDRRSVTTDFVARKYVY